MGPLSRPYMHVVSRKAILVFCERHPEARSALDYWYRVAKRAAWSKRRRPCSAPYVVFDIGGNRYRLIAEINFGRKVLVIRGILTHEDYEKRAWKQ